MARAPRSICRGGVGRYLLLIFATICASGCLSQQLRVTATRTVNTLPDLLYQQVVDNLAKMACNPSFLPYLAVAGQGSVQVTDNGNSLLALNLAPQLISQGAVSLGGSRNVTGTWTLGTITSPEKVRSMQAFISV